MAEFTNVARMHEAGLGLLRALGVQDTERVVGFALSFRHDEGPRLVVERLIGDEAGDKTTLAAVAALAPALEIEERAVEG